MESSIHGKSGKRGRKPKAPGGPSNRNQRLGQIFRAARKEENVTLQEMANTIEEHYGETLGSGYLSRFERGGINPSFWVVAALCDWFGISIDDLIKKEWEVESNEG